MHALLFFLIPLLVPAVSLDLGALEAKFPPCIVSALDYANILQLPGDFHLIHRDSCDTVRDDIRIYKEQENLRKFGWKKKSL